MARDLRRKCGSVSGLGLSLKNNVMFGKYGYMCVCVYVSSVCVRVRQILLSRGCQRDGG